MNLERYRFFLIDDSIIDNFSKFSSIFRKHFSKFNTLSFSIGGDKIQNVLWRINKMSLLLLLQHNIVQCSMVQTTLGIISTGYFR